LGVDGAIEKRSAPSSGKRRGKGKVVLYRRPREVGGRRLRGGKKASDREKEKILFPTDNPREEKKREPALFWGRKKRKRKGGGPSCQP